MNISINQQREQIKKYFDLLVKEFITNPKHKDISIVFQDFSDNPLKLGHTLQTKNERTQSQTTWQTINGINVLGSQRTSHHPLPYQYKYEIQFLAKGYKNEEELRGTVVHEFTHLYLFATIGSHNHDDRFYWEMERLESWLDKNQGLSPRIDKSHDRDQYVGDNNINSKENICSECSSSVPQHSLRCSHNQINACWECQRVFALGENFWEDANSFSVANPPIYCQACVKIEGLIKGAEVLVDSKNIIVDPQKITEFNQLSELLNHSSDLTVLEKNYQQAKESSLYSDKQFIGKNKLKNNDNKKALDALYWTSKWRLQNQLSSTSNSQSVLDKDGHGVDKIFWLVLAISGIIFLGLIGYLAGRKQNFRKNSQRRKI